ncbi:MAG: hypothetical protein HRT72_04670 [Flavobacteriales bacterium]|nr:hypothetical protein [Flavobacteriales bacterium]
MKDLKALLVLCTLYAIIGSSTQAGEKAKTSSSEETKEVKTSQTLQRGHYVTDPRFTKVDKNYYGENYLSMLLRFYNEEQSGYVGLVWHSKKYTNEYERERVELLARIEAFSGSSIYPLILKYDLHPDPYDVVATAGESWGRDLDTNDFKSLMDVVAAWGHYIAEFEAIYELAPKEDLPLLKMLTLHEPLSIAYADLEIAGKNGMDTLAAYMDAQRGALKSWIADNPDYMTENGPTEYHTAEPNRNEVHKGYYFMWLIEEAEAAAAEAAK